MNTDYWDPIILTQYDFEKAYGGKNYDKMEKVPHDDLEVVPNLMPFDSSCAAKLTFLYLNCWKKKTPQSF